MGVVAEILSWFLIDFLMVPAERVTERLWRGHANEPGSSRVLSAMWRSAATALIWLTWIALLLAIVVGIFYLIAG